MTIGDIIREYRQANNLSQRQFALKCNISNGYISMLERGVNPKTHESITPSLPALKAISKAMGMSLNELLATIDDMPIDIASEELNAATSREPVDIDYDNEITLSEHEKVLVIAYRSNPAMQSAVDKLLGIDEDASENIHIVKIAARGGDFKEVALTDSELEKIKKEINNLPDVDDL